MDGKGAATSMNVLILEDDARGSRGDRLAVAAGACFQGQVECINVTCPFTGTRTLRRDPVCSNLHGMTTGATGVDADTGTTASQIEDGGSMELVRLPAWEVKFRRGDNPDELAHFVCCRDLDWRKALCGYEATEDDVVLPESSMICTMCVEVCRGMGVEPGSGQCPIDNQPCPDDEEVDRLINERTSD